MDIKSTSKVQRWEHSTMYKKGGVLMAGLISILVLPKTSSFCQKRAVNNHILTHMHMTSNMMHIIHGARCI